MVRSQASVTSNWATIDTGAQYGQGYLLGRPGFPMTPSTWPPPPLSDREVPTVPPRASG